MKHEKLIEKHLGINTPDWIKTRVDNAINEALSQLLVRNSICPACKREGYKPNTFCCPHCGYTTVGQTVVNDSVCDHYFPATISGFENCEFCGQPHGTSP